MTQAALVPGGLQKAPPSQGRLDLLGDADSSGSWEARVLRVTRCAGPSASLDPSFILPWL